MNIILNKNIGEDHHFYDIKKKQRENEFQEGKLNLNKKVPFLTDYLIIKQNPNWIHHVVVLGHTVIPNTNSFPLDEESRRQRIKDIALQGFPLL